jgi:hypothetical protein
VIINKKKNTDKQSCCKWTIERRYKQLLIEWFL